MDGSERPRRVCRPRRDAAGYARARTAGNGDGARRGGAGRRYRPLASGTRLQAAMLRWRLSHPGPRSCCTLAGAGRSCRDDLAGRSQRGHRCRARSVRETPADEADIPHPPPGRDDARRAGRRRTVDRRARPGRSDARGRGRQDGRARGASGGDEFGFDGAPVRSGGADADRHVRQGHAHPDGQRRLDRGARPSGGRAAGQVHVRPPAVDSGEVAGGASPGPAWRGDEARPRSVRQTRGQTGLDAMVGGAVARRATARSAAS